MHSRVCSNASWLGVTEVTSAPWYGATGGCIQRSKTGQTLWAWSHCYVHVGHCTQVRETLLCLGVQHGTKPRGVASVTWVHAVVGRFDGCVSRICQSSLEWTKTLVHNFIQENTLHNGQLSCTIFTRTKMQSKSQGFWRQTIHGSLSPLVEVLWSFYQMAWILVTSLLSGWDVMLHCVSGTNDVC